METKIFLQPTFAAKIKYQQNPAGEENKWKTNQRVNWQMLKRFDNKR